MTSVLPAVAVNPLRSSVNAANGRKRSEPSTFTLRPLTLRPFTFTFPSTPLTLGCLNRPMC
jgi:hypothetical protein